jgi:hypothetical protein
MEKLPCRSPDENLYVHPLLADVLKILSVEKGCSNGLLA